LEIPRRVRRPRKRHPNKMEQLIVLLSAVLAICLIIALLIPTSAQNSGPQLQSTNPPTQPSSSVVPPSSSAVTPPTSLPPETFPPVTTPPATKPGLEYIGNLYTRTELEALDRTMNLYGIGKNVDEKNRPINALNLDKQYEKYDAHFIGPDNGKIYLTYTATYEHEGNVKKTLDILKAKNVKAVFFVDKAFARLYPELTRQIIDDGHILGNHCTTHPKLPELTIDKIVKQIMDIHEYVKAYYGYEMRLFRPPSGYFSEQVWAIAQSLGYRSYNYSFTYRDWDRENQPNPQSSLDKMIHALHSGAIYYLHAISSTNVAIMEDFIDTARSQGYEFEILP